MPLSPGTRLGSYELLALVGAGGMGEVYKARDTRLDRTVAVKVLLAHVAGGPERRARFEREARAIAALSHPHICTVHDVGRHEEIDYLVMEYLDGETLADRLARAKGPLAVEQALRVGIDIADALDRAHRAGIVHRDLKPANVMLTKSGAKLLDFGLAKLRPSGGAVALQGAEMSLTRTTPLTGDGTILGTVQYMAPEQIEGGEADGRTDIFALGLVLYEMLTGKRPFEGKAQASLIGAILKDTPAPIATLQPLVPAALDHAVNICLAKDPDDRWQSARDVLRELTWISETGQQAAISPAPAPVARATRGYRAGLAAAAIVTIAAIAFGIFAARRAPLAEPPAVRFLVTPPPTFTFIGASGNASVPTVSPDGRLLAAVVTRLGTGRIWVRSMDSLEGQVLPGTEGASTPYWSPDSRSLVFSVTNTLKIIAASGGPVRTLCTLPSSFAGAAWGPDGAVVFGGRAGLFRISASGGTPMPLTRLDASHGETSHGYPAFLPDGRHVLYSATPSNTVWVVSLETASEPKLLLASPASQALFVPPAWLLFVRQGTLFAQSFDTKRLTLTGEAVALASQVIQSAPDWAFGASSNGVLAYRTGAVSVPAQLTWADRTGKRLGSVGSPGYYRNPALSPDGTRVAVEAADPQTGTQDIWLIERARGVPTRFTFDPADDLYPVWSPDGSAILFGSNRGHSDRFSLYRKRADGVGPEDVMVQSSTDMTPLNWSADGHFVVYRSRFPFYNLGILPLVGEPTPYLFEAVPFVQGQGQVSPDGRWLAYNSNESGRYEINVQSFPKPGGGKWQISKDGGGFPRWRRDGKELFYYASDGRLMAVPISGTTGLEQGIATPLFEPRLLNGPANTAGYRAQYDVSPDGQHFLLNLPVDEATASPMAVVLNWPTQVKK